MRQYITYVCERCGQKSEDKNKIYACEASHLGLTTEQKQQYDTLQKNVELASAILNLRHNERTINEFDDAIKKLLDFEKQYNITIDGL